MKKLQLKKEVIESLDKTNVKGGMADMRSVINVDYCIVTVQNSWESICPRCQNPGVPKTDADMISCRDYPGGGGAGGGSGMDKLTIYIYEK